MKKIIKIIFPEVIKKILRKIENFVYRLKFAFTKPIIITDKFGINIVLYPEQNAPIRWQIDEGAYKKEFLAMDRLVNPGNIVFDVGSHVGIVACYLAKKITGSGKIHSFEPFPNSYKRLNENISINNYKNINVNQVAVSNKVGISNFYFDPENWQLNSLGKVNNGDGNLNKYIEVKVETIDNYCETNYINKINFLKIDTEGYEYDVLMGAEKMLNNKHIDAIQFEISRRPLESIGKNPEEIMEYLKTKGYNVYEYIEEHEKFKKVDSITAWYDNYYASHENLEKK